MSEKTESEEFEEEAEEDAVVEGDADDIDIEHLMEGIDHRKGADAKAGEPAWRRLERYREERHTAELLCDFDDYDIVSEDEAATFAPRRKAQRS